MGNSNKPTTIEQAFQETLSCLPRDVQRVIESYCMSLCAKGVPVVFNHLTDFRYVKTFPQGGRLILLDLLSDHLILQLSTFNAVHFDLSSAAHSLLKGAPHPAYRVFDGARRTQFMCATHANRYALVSDLPELLEVGGQAIGLCDCASGLDNSILGQGERTHL